MTGYQRYAEEARRLLELERAEEIAQHDALVKARGLEAFAEAGLAIPGLSAHDEGGGLGGRYLVSYGLPRAGERLPESRIGIGDLVRVVDGRTRDPDSGPSGLVSARTAERITVAFDAFPEDLPGSGLAVVQAPNDVTFRRQVEALRTVGRFRIGRVAELRELLYGEASKAPGFDGEKELAPFDPLLDHAQLAAVRRALAARDVALVHGPPGTGKTTTLVEIIRQGIARGERVLATAASNTAVDNLVEKLADAGARVLRVGHPARVNPLLHEATLDFRVRNEDGFRVSRRLLEEARELMRRRARLSDRVARGRADVRDVRDEKRELGREIGRLMEDVRRLERQAVELIFSRADVVCATLTGVASSLLTFQIFDLVVIDEATQATGPATLLPLLRVGENARLILAGDPHQLPPTVLSPQAAREGLARTLFERLADRWGDEVRCMLTVQYRMHERIMRFASQRFYGGRLKADPRVAGHLLTGLPGVRDEELTETPLELLDTAGRGFEESRARDSESASNEGEAELAARRVRELLEAGVAPGDLAVISPYAAQVQVLRGLLSDVDGLEIGTVDGFQGREKEAVVVSLVRSNERGEVGFLADVRRMNVAWTRARRKLVVIGDGATLACHPFYAGMMEYVEAEGIYRSAWELT